MRKIMRSKPENDKRVNEQDSKYKRFLSERNSKADQLLEYWSKERGIGEGMVDLADKDINRARGLSLVLENQFGHLKKLTETQLSNAFQTTPENVMRIVRLGYPNSVRGELFLEWAMQTARDSIYYLSPVYASSLRGATSGAVTHESSANRYFSELEEESTNPATGNGAATQFVGSAAGNLVNPPLRPFTVKVLVDDEPVAVDDGEGNIIGSLLNTGATNTINYTTGAFEINFTAAPASGATIVVAYAFDSEISTQYTDIGEVQLQLRDYQFRARPWPLGVGWSKMTELLLGTTLDIDAEEALIRGAADELKKSLDFQAVLMAYRYSKSNSVITFNADFTSAGSDSETEHAQSITRAIDDAGDVIFSALQRGGVSKIVGGPKATNYVKLHKRFSAAGSQPAVGVHKVGSLDQMDIYKSPSTFIPTNELLCIWKNDLVPEDVSLAFGTLVPLYRTQTLEFKEFYKETGLAHFGDSKALQSKYLVRVQLTNLT